MPKITFLLHDGERIDLDVNIGENILEIAHKNGVPLEGACEGSLACSTCHVIVENYYDKLPDATEGEEDMLDEAVGLSPTSRLGCQLTMTQELDGLTLRIPEHNRNSSF